MDLYRNPDFSTSQVTFGMAPHPDAACIAQCHDPVPLLPYPHLKVMTDWSYVKI